MPDSHQITLHKTAVARVIRLEDALLEALTGQAGGSHDERCRKLREALAEAYRERERTQRLLFG